MEDITRFEALRQELEQIAAESQIDTSPVNFLLSEPSHAQEVYTNSPIIARNKRVEVIRRG